MGGYNGLYVPETLKCFSQPNRLINPYFVRAVNQIGNKSASGPNKMLIDGWKICGYESGTATVTETGISLTGRLDFGQVLESNWLPDTSGTYITISCLLSNGELAWKTQKLANNIASEDVLTPLPPYGYLHFARHWPSIEANTDLFYFGVNCETQFSVVAAKLELGDAQTLAHKENGVWVLNRTTRYEDELRRCQEQYINTTGDLNSPYALQAVNSNTLFGSATFPVEMRITPVMRNLTLRRVADGTIIQTTSAVLQGGPKGLYAITGIQPANLVVGEWYQLMCEFDARL